MAVQIRRPLQRALPWLPAVLVVAAGLASALGIQPIPAALAVTGNVTVSATVEAEVHMTPSPCGGTSSYTFTAILPSEDDTAAASCATVFGTNNGASSTLQVHDANTTASFLCIRPAASPTGACTASANDDFGSDAWTPNANLPEGTIGFDPSATGCTLVTPYDDADTAKKFPFPDAADDVCTKTGTGDATLTLNIAWDPDAAQTASANYQGRLTLTATAA